MRMRHTVIRGLPGFTIFFHITFMRNKYTIYPTITAVNKANETKQGYWRCINLWNGENEY